MPHPNEQVVRTAVEAFRTGNLDGVLATLSDDVVVHVPGQNKLSGDYKGRQEFAENFVGTIMSLTGGQFVLEPHDIVGGDQHVCGIYTLRATRDGRTFEWPHVNVYHVSGGKITEVWQTPGTYEEWNAFWS